MAEEPLHASAVVQFRGGPTIRVATADTPRALARGLMFREGLADVDGMLFVFDRADLHPFWMRHVCFSLDILWIGAEGSVVDVVADASPCPRPPCPIYAPRANARMVLEVPAGFARAHGITVGTEVAVARTPE